jgi:uncharacterized protein YndB with AHSA1/START domain
MRNQRLHTEASMQVDDEPEVGTIARELYIEAAPETVFDVVSRPEHVAQWWPDTASYDVAVGASGEITFGDPETDGARVALTVLEVDPPRTFTFRWTHETGSEPSADNSLLVTIELTASGSGTVLRLVETGFRERGWDQATTEATFREHVSGWDHFLPRLVAYAAGLATRS